MKPTLLLLPVYLLTSIVNNNSIWNIARTIFGTNVNNHEIIYPSNSSLSFLNTTEPVLKVFYPKNSYSPSKTPVGGIGFYSSPKNIFMANDVLFSYQVFFDPSFQSVHGGKLPGLSIGKNTSKKNFLGASGGVHSKSSSCRIAWRSDFVAEAYLYLPNDHPQHSDYYNIPNLVENKIYGDSLWRALFKFEQNQWNNISIRLKTNTFTNNIPNYDGTLVLTINNVTNQFNKFIWRTDKNYNLNAIIFETFFGGSKPSTATPVDTWSYFKNVSIQKIN